MTSEQANDPLQSSQFISDTGQITVDGELRIGAGNIWADQDEQPGGQQREGLTAGLWFFFRTQPELNQHMRVHAGQSVRIGGYQATVVEIEQGGVTLELWHPRAEARG